MIGPMHLAPSGDLTICEICYFNVELQGVTAQVILDLVTTSVAR